MADDHTFHLEILTPERQFFSADVEALTFTGADGEWTILRGHAPMVVVLRPGALKIKQYQMEKRELLESLRGDDRAVLKRGMAPDGLGCHGKEVQLVFGFDAGELRRQLDDLLEKNTLSS